MAQNQSLMSLFACVIANSTSNSFVFISTTTSTISTNRYGYYFSTFKIIINLMVMTMISIISTLFIIQLCNNSTTTRRHKSQFQYSGTFIDIIPLYFILFSIISKNQKSHFSFSSIFSNFIQT